MKRDNPPLPQVMSRLWGVSLMLALMVFLAGMTATAQEKSPKGNEVGPQCNKVTADVVAFDQIIFYNRFGSYDPGGMMYALRRDVVPITGTTIGPGNVQLRPDKRPRPLVLRVNEGDCLQVHFTNLLTPVREDVEDLVFANAPNRRPYYDRQPTFGQVFTQLNGAIRRIVQLPGGQLRVRENGQTIDDGFVALSGGDTPATRTASIHVNGLDYVDIGSDGANVGNNISSVVQPGVSIDYTWYAAKKGQYLLYSMAAHAGGEGDGGQPDHGLFGSVNVEPAGSVWYRSQVTNEVLDKATIDKTPLGQPVIDYDSKFANGDPVLKILRDGSEIIYTDLNAIVTGFTPESDGCIDDNGIIAVLIAPPSSTCGQPFREFTVIFHDELETGKPAFPELIADESVFHSVRDGFGINYGASGLGAILLANRKKVGPAFDCPECPYEEFFLDSWVNGDPALLVRVDPTTGKAVEGLFPDDPSNVHHSYMGDPVRFRNLHAGPKETHVFHLHAHQWLQSPRDQNSTYLDSQSISPGAAFTYEINYGGTGNRNFVVGDSIFHCHLYPHFAQGMWELYRSHDVFEDGSASRNLPDGEITNGTPNPAIVPIPDKAMPLMPTDQFKGYPFYIAAVKGHRAPQPPLSLDRDGGLQRHVVLSGQTVDGLPAIPVDRQADQVFQRVIAQNNDPNLTNFARELVKANLLLLPNDGTPEEKDAMTFHAGQAAGNVSVPPTQYGWPARGYTSYTSSGQPDVFLVNGRAQQPGAPYSDPCPDSYRPDVTLGGVRSVPLRKYRTAWIQFDPDGPPTDLYATLKVNNAKWHDRQGRIAVLEQDALPTLNGIRPPEPLFFRANSGDCIDYRVTNLIPAALNLDDFQVYQPTDMIGQHIHLVKFDVTASDGAANGFNYESGAFSPEEVRTRIHAYKAYLEEQGIEPFLEAVPNPTFGRGRNDEWVGAQTLIERWWADPLVNREGKDRTIRTVFTHDHFSPSGHQHHGLYAGLIVEPTDAVWKFLDGTPMGGPATSPPLRADGGPTSFAANLHTGPNDSRSFREFNLEIADFGIVYTEDNIPVSPPNRVEHAPPFIVGSKDIDHPERFPFPEAISSADPGTQLINYRNEPIPLRIGQDVGGTFQQKTGPAGNVAFTFSSVIHGDPFTPLLKAYPGDRVQIKLLQGAQEEQHVVNVHGNRWFFEPGTPHSTMEKNSGLTNSFAVGISEHFEMDFADGVLPIFVQRGVADYLYQSAAVDNLWDGQWGILRAYRDTQPDLARLPRFSGSGNGTVPGEETIPPTPFADDVFREAPLADGAELDEFDPVATTNPDEPDPELEALIAGTAPKGGAGSAPSSNAPGSGGINHCPTFAGAPPIKQFIIEAWLAKDLLQALPNGAKGIIYNNNFDFKDPAGIVFINALDRFAIKTGQKKLEPLVIRVNSGDCMEVRLRNRLPNVLPEYDSWNEVPPIIPRFNFNQVTTSNRVSLHAQILAHDVSGSDGAVIGYNPNTTVKPHNVVRYAWYAGRVQVNNGTVTLTPAEFGVTHLRDYGDVIKHSSHGAVGALVIEPSGAQYKDVATNAPLNSGAAANILDANGQTLFREFVVHYQDDLTMQDKDGAIEFGGQVFPNTGMRNMGDEDDSEDSGQKAFNYRNEPFWARLNLPPETDLQTTGDQIYTDILSSKVPNAGCTTTPCDPATPIFSASPGVDVRFRVLQAAGHARQHGFTLFGHHWQYEPWQQNSTVLGNNPLTFEVGSYSHIGPTRHLNILIKAGGQSGVTGDFLYRTQDSFNFSGGMWGVFRVQ